MQGTRRARAATGAGRGAQGDAAPSSPIGSGQLARLGLRASLAALSVRLWYLQAVTIGHQESNKHEDILGVYVYLTCWTLVLVAMHCFAALVDAARRAAGNADGRLTAAVHATAGLKFTAIAFMVLAFYTLIWPDATFQRDSVARKEAQGIPFGRYMHEIHALPAVFILADLAGALQPQLLAHYAPSTRVSAAQAVAFGATWAAVQELNRIATGAAPYAILAAMPLRARLTLDAICLTGVAFIAVAFRAAIISRAPGASAAATPAKKRR